MSVGGQLPQNIALKLQEAGKAKILGTDPRDIDKAENRQKFSGILDSKDTLVFLPPTSYSQGLLWAVLGVPRSQDDRFALPPNK